MASEVSGEGRDLPGLVIGGPTASGKTRVAVEVAERCGGEIVGADAFQIYEGLPILTAQPRREERARVPHHLVGEMGLEERMDVQRYVELARERIRRVWAAGRVPILVGGTGLYIRGVLKGLSEGLPGPDFGLREELERRELGALQEELRRRDPEGAAAVDLRNPRRVIRALEVCLLTGRPFSSFRKQVEWDRGPVGVWLQWERAELGERIEERTEQMWAEGVVEEIQVARGRVGVTARQVIGFEAILGYLEGRQGAVEVRKQIAMETRQYAKRQETWFRKEEALLPVGFGEAVRVAVEICVRGGCVT